MKLIRLQRVDTGIVRHCNFFLKIIKLKKRGHSGGHIYFSIYRLSYVMRYDILKLLFEKI